MESVRRGVPLSSDHAARGNWARAFVAHQRIDEPISESLVNPFAIVVHIELMNRAAGVGGVENRPGIQVLGGVVRVNKENRPFVPVMRSGAVLPEVKEVLDVIAKNGLTLATGIGEFLVTLRQQGFSPAEIRRIAKENPAGLLGLEP